MLFRKQILAFLITPEVLFNYHESVAFSKATQNGLPSHYSAKYHSFVCEDVV